ELGRPELEADRADQRRRDDVVDRVLGAVALEVEELVAPVECADAERQLSVTEHLRRVHRQVATRVHGGAKAAQIDVTGGLSVSRRDAEHSCESRGDTDTGTDGHVASEPAPNLSYPTDTKRRGGVKRAG